ncbi:MAG: VCBS repeat-containing protein [Siphonobacter sp.]
MTRMKAMGLLGIVSAICLTIISCENTTKTDETEEGTALTKQYCGSCHLPLMPEVLDKETWLKHVLPAMAKKMGIPTTAGGEYYQVANGSKAAILPFKDWLRIVEFFKKNAPDSLKTLPREALKEDWAVFELKKPVNKVKVAMTTMVKFLDNGILSSQNNDPVLYSWNQSMVRSAVMPLPSPAVDATLLPNNEVAVTSIGTLLAVDQPVGKLFTLNLKTKKTETIAGGLPRPIQSQAGDFNKDGRMDWLVCGFGHERGGLYLVTQQADGQYESNQIYPEAGATQVIVDDFNKDGWPDAMALFAHGNEGIWLFENDHKGGFTTKNILRFSPVAGSTSFQLVDMNKDGKLDIVYTSGDNSDYSKILKPFHGVYIYLNQGNYNYKQAYFYPVNGATKVIAGDFDLDGDQDLATIAFFADFQHTPAEGFIYFEQDKPLHFQLKALPIHQLGRWICMDANDWDGDGDLDIVLGNYSKGFNNIIGFKQNWATDMPLIMLENKTKK